MLPLLVLVSLRLPLLLPPCTSSSSSHSPSAPPAVEDFSTARVSPAGAGGRAESPGPRPPPPLPPPVPHALPPPPPRRRAAASTARRAGSSSRMRRAGTVAQPCPRAGPPASVRASTPPPRLPAPPRPRALLCGRGARRAPAWCVGGAACVCGRRRAGWAGAGVESPSSPSPRLPLSLSRTLAAPRETDCVRRTHADAQTLYRTAAGTRDRARV
jgi:hypothetical protein